jgi:hypothetical protein
MHKIVTFLLILITLAHTSQAQDKNNLSTEKFGNALNIGVGIGYSGYRGHTGAAIMLNYEFDVAPSFTLAPFIGYYSYSNFYYWGNKNYPYRNYTYRETSIPIGIKGAYYFDKLLKAGPKWDFYLGASLGFVLRTVTWENGYYGDKYGYYDNNGFRGSSPLYLNLHVGTEVHLSQKIGLFLDLSTGMSALGLAVHF